MADSLMKGALMKDSSTPDSSMTRSVKGKATKEIVNASGASQASEQKLQWWASPAKLNIFLHILGRFDNGYHQLQSLFQMLDYGDELAFDVTNDGKITMATPLEVVPEPEP